MPNYTREQPKEVSLPVRLPLIGIPNQRAASPDEDSRLINAYVEMGEDEVLRVVKRPGLTLARTLGGTVGGGMQGEYAMVVSAVDGGWVNKLYSGTTLLGSVTATAGAIPTSDHWSFEIVPTGVETTDLFFHNRKNAYTYNATNGIRTLPFQGQTDGPRICSITNGSTVVGIADTTGLVPYTLVTGTGIQADTFIESVDTGTQFTISLPATATNASAALSFVMGGPPSRPGISGIATINGGLSTAQHLAWGVEDLNKSTYLFTYRGIVTGSDIEDPFAWNPLNIIYAYAEQDEAIALAKQNSYLVTFKGISVEFFRDVGLSPGSPLERLEGLRLNVGCYDGRTVRDVDGTLFWVSNTETGLKSVWMMRDTKAVEIAPPSIRRILQALDPTISLGFSVSGHSFYAITDAAAGVTLVYSSGIWSYWNGLGETYFPFVSATNVGSTTYLQHESNGSIYQLDPNALDDDGTDIVMDIYPPQFDANMRVSKFVARMYVIADQAEGSILQVRFSESDQAEGSWSNWREFDLSKGKPDLYDCGSFTKRFYHFRHSSATRCRLTSVEMDILPGTL